MGAFDSNLPFNGDNIGNTLGTTYSNLLGNLSSGYFTDPYQSQINAGMNKTFGDLGNINPQQFAQQTYNLGLKDIQDRYQLQDMGMKHNFGNKGFLNSSSYVLAKDLQNKGFSRDIADLAERSSLYGENLYNQRLNSLQNSLNLYTQLGLSPYQYYQNLYNSIGSDYNNMIGRKNELEQIKNQNWMNAINGVSNAMQSYLGAGGSGSGGTGLSQQQLQNLINLLGGNKTP